MKEKKCTLCLGKKYVFYKGKYRLCPNCNDVWYVNPWWKKWKKNAKMDEVQE